MIRVQITTLALLAFTFPAVAAEPHPAAVRVSTATAGGSGVAVYTEAGRTLIVSNNHIFAPDPPPGRNYGPAKVPQPATVASGGKSYPATVILTDAWADIAFLSVESTLPCAPLADAISAAGTAVTHHGAGSGPQTGRVLPPRPQYLRPSDGFSASVVCKSGDSGAGVFDKAGSVIAITCGRTGVAPDAPLRGTPASEVWALVTGSVIDQFPKFPTAGELVEQTVSDGFGGTLTRRVWKPFKP